MKEPETPKTMLKKEEWGGLTFVALLGAYVFPPYFVYLMTVAALTEFAHLWTTRLSREAQDKFIQFEKEFRQGYKLEKAGKKKEALKKYKDLEKKYSNHPQALHLTRMQIEKMTGGSAPKKKGA